MNTNTTTIDDPFVFSNETKVLIHQTLDALPHGLSLILLGLVEFAVSFGPLCFLAFLIAWILNSGLPTQQQQPDHKNRYRLPDSEMIGTTWGALSFTHMVTTLGLFATELTKGRTPMAGIVWWSLVINTALFGGLALAVVVGHRTWAVYSSRLRGFGGLPRTPPTYSSLPTEDRDDLEAGFQRVQLTGGVKKHD